MKNSIFLLFLMLALFMATKTKAQCANNGNLWNKSWVSCQKSANPNPIRDNTHWILYDFEDSNPIGETHIWNANRIGESGWGAKDVLIDYSIDGINWVQFGTYIFPQASENSSYTGFSGPDFGGILVKKILITILSTHSNSACASIAEVKFNIANYTCNGTLDECGVCNGSGIAAGTCDCEGTLPTVWYADADNDGLGDAAISQQSCTQPAAYVLNADDNDDSIPINTLELNGDLLGQILVIPNPASDFINVSVAGNPNRVLHIKLFDVQGKLVLGKILNDVSSNSFSLDISTFSDGLYLLQVENNGTAQQATFIVD